MLLRYFALWGTLALNPNSEDQPQATFLHTQGLNESDLKRLTDKFVKAGIVAVIVRGSKGDFLLFNR